MNTFYNGFEHELDQFTIIYLKHLQHRQARATAVFSFLVISSAIVLLLRNKQERKEKDKMDTDISQTLSALWV